jgi:hypothetical protein
MKGEKMKTFFVIQISLLLAFPLYAQYNSSLGKVDTVTMGEYDDANPVLIHGTFDHGYSRSYQWLLFGRNTQSSSEIVGKKFLTDDALWDTSVVVISSSNIPASQRNPDISGISYPQNNFSRLAAWERKENNVWNIYCSRFMDNDSTWMPSQPLTQDIVDNTNAQIRPLTDSSFIVVWKRKSVLLYSIVNSVTFSVPETIAVGTFDSLEFDILSRYGSGNLVWTSRDTTNKNIMIFRSFETYPSFTLTAPETLFISQSAFNPRFTLSFYGDKSVFFETFVNGNREIMMWKEYYPQEQRIENISNDSLADDRNPRAFSNPVVTKRGSVNKKSNFPYYGILTMEKYTNTDSMLIFFGGYYLADTVKSAGYNRNACIGSDMFINVGKLSVLTVWESNRSGHSHIFSRLVRLPMDGVEPPIISLRSFTLEQNYPNPFNPTTNFRFTIAHSELVSLKVFDLLGREVTTIVNEPLTPGDYLKQWNASNIATGIYFYRLKTDSFTKTKKLILLR